MRRVHKIGVPEGYVAKPRPKSKKEPKACEICGKILSGPAELAYHIMAIHEGSYPYVCEKCGRGFVKASKLKIHVTRVHENYKPHQCPHCERTFAHSHTMKSHIEALHSDGLRKYLCDRCEYRVSFWPIAIFDSD